MTTDEQMRAQLRAMYVWRDGAAGPELDCPDRFTNGGFLGRIDAMVARLVQDDVRQRALDDIAVIRLANRKRRRPGYELLEVLPAHLAPYANG